MNPRARAPEKKKKEEEEGGNGVQWGPALSNLLQYFQSSARIRAAFPLVSSPLHSASLCFVLCSTRSSRSIETITIHVRAIVRSTFARDSTLARTARVRFAFSREFAQSGSSPRSNVGIRSTLRARKSNSLQCILESWRWLPEATATGKLCN